MASAEHEKFKQEMAELWADVRFDEVAIDPWDEGRDARLYRGPHPVIAHRPCQRFDQF